MQKKTRSLLDELDRISLTNERESVLESRAAHVIQGAINIISLIRETYDPETAAELERRLINSIRGQDPAKFSRGLRKIK